MSIETKSDAQHYASLFAVGETALSIMIEYNREDNTLFYFREKVNKIDRFSLPSSKITEDALNKGLSEIKEDLKSNKYKDALEKSRQMYTMMKFVQSGI